MASELACVRWYRIIMDYGRVDEVAYQNHAPWPASVVADGCRMICYEAASERLARGITFGRSHSHRSGSSVNWLRVT
jgi:hypothetical protein